VRFIKTLKVLAVQALAQGAAQHAAATPEAKQQVAPPALGLSTVLARPHLRSTVVWRNTRSSRGARN
jgi:hypothetical protein